MENSTPIRVRRLPAKWIECTDACAGDIACVTRHQGHLALQRCCGKKTIHCGDRIGNIHQTPAIRGSRIDWNHPRGKLIHQTRQPLLNGDG